MNQTLQTKWIALSVRIYCALLVLYPADYRLEYGGLMAQIFRDVARDAYRNQGWLGMVWWWCKTLLDLVLTVIEQRRKAKFTMSKSTFIQLTGVFLFLGGAFGVLASGSQLQPGDHYTYYGVYQVMIVLFAPSFLLISLGCIGLALRYASALGSGKWSLYITGIGLITMTVGMIAMLASEVFWNLWLDGAIIHLMGLVWFGVLFARKPVLPIFRWLPLQIVIGWLMMMGVTDRFPQTFDNLLRFLMALGIGLAWLSIGLVIHRQQRTAELSPA